MAKNEIKVNITAETTQFERNIASLKNKLGEAFLTPNQFSIGAAPNSSYTIGGRTFTKANLSDIKKHLEPLAEYLFPRDPPLDRPRPSSACASSCMFCNYLSRKNKVAHKRNNQKQNANPKRKKRLRLSTSATSATPIASRHTLLLSH